MTAIPPPQVLYVVTYEVDEEDRELFERFAGAHADAGDAYPGCLRFTLGQDVLHAGRYQLVELWRSQSDFDAHARSREFQVTQAALSACRTLRVKPERYEVAPPAR